MIFLPKTSTLEVHPIICRSDIMSSFVYFREICLCMHFPRHLPCPFEVNLIYTYVVSANKLKSFSCTHRFNWVKQKYHYRVMFFPSNVAAYEVSLECLYVVHQSVI